MIHSRTDGAETPLRTVEQAVYLDALLPHQPLRTRQPQDLTVDVGKTSQVRLAMPTERTAGAAQNTGIAARLPFSELFAA